MSTTIASSIHKPKQTIAAALNAVALTLCIGSSALANAPIRVEITGTQVKGDQITTRVYVTGEKNVPIESLRDNKFELLVDDQTLTYKDFDWKRPGEGSPPPSYTIVLLDMSGSMRAEDSQGTSRIEGALTAIRQFKNVLAERTKFVPEENIPQIAIVPFGEGCSDDVKGDGYIVSSEQLSRFFPVNGERIDGRISFLEKQVPCASTNLYEPIKTALAFLGDRSNRKFHISEDDDSQKEPRLSIILLSDGFHNAGNEAEEFKALSDDILQNPDIIVHSLGYGLTPEELGINAGLGRPAVRNDINRGLIDEEEFVDAERLAEIANLTGGISEFSGDAVAVSEKLQIFLSALLGEYEITYTQPNAVRGSLHTVQALVQTPDDGYLVSEEAAYTIRAIGSQPLPGAARASLFASTLFGMGIFGVLPFWAWSNKLKKDA